MLQLGVKTDWEIVGLIDVEIVNSSFNPLENITTSAIFNPCAKNGMFENVLLKVYLLAQIDFIMRLI